MSSEPEIYSGAGEPVAKPAAGPPGRTSSQIRADIERHREREPRVGEEEASGAEGGLRSRSGGGGHGATLGGPRGASHHPLRVKPPPPLARTPHYPVGRSQTSELRPPKPSSPGPMWAPITGPISETKTGSEPKT